MSVQIFKQVTVEAGQGQIIYIDDSAAQIKVDNQVFWVSREELDRLLLKEGIDDHTN